MLINNFQKKTLEENFNVEIISMSLEEKYPGDIDQMISVRYKLLKSDTIISWYVLLKEGEALYDKLKKSINEDAKTN